MAKVRRYEHEAAADTFLAPGGGGLIVWVRRDEALPRASVRFRGEDMPLEEAVVLLACLRSGLDVLMANLAELLDVSTTDLEEMVEIARKEVLAPRMRAESFREPSHKDKTT